jgi:hypothetical protein
MIYFIRYLIVWISQNLSIPFWVVGHVHLMLNVYEDLHEILMSLGMNIIVAIGFYISYKDDLKNNNYEANNKGRDKCIE